MKIGLSSYSLSKAMQAGQMTVLDAVDWIAAHGGEHIELVPIGFNLHEQPELIGRLRTQAEQAGIDISGYAVGANFITADDAAYEREIRRVMGEVDVAAALGVRRMRHDVASRTDTSMKRFMTDLPRLADACRRVADYAQTLGVTTSVENHGYYIQASDRVQALLHAVDHPSFRTTLDIGNFMCADEPPVAAVSKNIAYASMVHVKDFYWRSAAGPDPGQGWFRSASGAYLRGAIAGHGDIPLLDALRVIKRSGYDGYISLEFEGLEECRLGSEIGLNNVRRLWNEA